MKITEEEVRYVADLANLALSPEELVRMAREMDSILTHMDKLNKLDTGDIEPMTQVSYEAGETATLRADREAQTLSNREAVGGAPLEGAGFFKVPRVIER